jgi:hypothetical protein
MPRPHQGSQRMKVNRRSTTILWWIAIPLNSTAITMEVHHGLLTGDWNRCWIVPIFIFGILSINYAKNYYDRQEHTAKTNPKGKGLFDDLR